MFQRFKVRRYAEKPAEKPAKKSAEKPAEILPAHVIYKEEKGSKIIAQNQSFDCSA